MKLLSEVQFETFISQLQSTLKAGINRGNTVLDFVDRRNAKLKNRRNIFSHINKGIKEFKIAIDELEKEK